MDEIERPLGVVPLDGRGSLPYALVHGESLVAAASWALTTAEVDLFDFNVAFAQVQDTGRMLVVHDPLCPLTPSGFLAEAVAEAQRSGAVVVGVRPHARLGLEGDTAWVARRGGGPADGVEKSSVDCGKDTVASFAQYRQETVLFHHPRLDVAKPKLAAEVAQTTCPVRSP